MLIRRTDTSQPAGSEITPQAVYQDRRRLIAAAGFASLATFPVVAAAQKAPAEQALQKLPAVPSPLSTMERATSLSDATTYNNYYEFGTDKADPARNAGTPAAPAVDALRWRAKWHGRATFDIEELLKLAPQEERIYRMRCVEGWSMVIPWIGYPLSELIKQVEPTGKAKFVEFVTLADPKQMPGLRSDVLGWPYVEGLRMDEAMHPLAILTFGMYGDRAAQPERRAGARDGALEVRLQVRQVDRQDPLHREAAGHQLGRAGPSEYGFYSNVNPEVDHPRWSQATERRIGEDGFFQRKRKTLLFNGYTEQVASCTRDGSAQEFLTGSPA